MHRIYETDAIVLNGSPAGESDRQLLLFTREFGVVSVSARGLRELKSKLRYSVQPYSRAVVNLVRGKGGWRLTNARLLAPYYQRFAGGPRLVILARVLSLLRRMVQGQERNAALFDTVVSGVAFLAAVGADHVKEVELVLVLRILRLLGYVGDSPALAALFSGTWDAELLAAARRGRPVLLRSVNESLKVSQL